MSLAIPAGKSRAATTNRMPVYMSRGHGVHVCKRGSLRQYMLYIVIVHVKHARGALAMNQVTVMHV